MSKFSVGDRVRVVKAACGAYGVNGKEGVVTLERKTNGKDEGLRVNVAGKVWVLGESEEVNVELVPTNNEGEKTMRRTFKLLKDTPTIKKGALWQEAYEDGDQEYKNINFETHHKSGVATHIEDRSLVENQPEWFVEVFKVEPEYMTREELDRYQEFLKGKKSAKTVKPVKAQRAPWTAERRKRFEKTQKAKRGQY